MVLEERRESTGGLRLLYAKTSRDQNNRQNWAVYAVYTQWNGKGFLDAVDFRCRKNRG
jgi:hypothetical protein